MRSRVLLLPLLFLVPVSGCSSSAPSSRSVDFPLAAPPASSSPSAAEAPPAEGPAAEAPAAEGPAAEGPAAEGLAADDPPPATRAAVPEKTRAATPKPKPAPTKPKLPAGRAPDFLVGEWSGGFGGSDTRYLVVTRDGRYERGLKTGEVESTGTVVANDDSATFYDTGGGKEKAFLTYTDAAGIIVLSVNYAEQGYYSYVPF